MQYWLMKSEPDEFSFDDLEAKGKKGEMWDGVRNYQARNFMRDMRVGDQVFFYHSNTTPPGIVGIAEIAKMAYPDPTQFDPEDDHFDAKSTTDNPRWDVVDVRFVRRFAHKLPLSDLKDDAALDDMYLTRKGNRLSVMPVEKDEWEHILDLSEHADG
ncbi:EVE domain-containing protein [Suttonella sp. R2A3]|uniref:EVE domain-containing protein n=1 Tax=Suttonella sp. R2A3 TaxID=2908648 RepID=UPI0038FCF833